MKKETEILEQAKIDARKILQDAKSMVSDAIQEINASYENLSNSTIRSLNNTRNKLNNSIRETSTIPKIDKTELSFLTKEDIYIGMPVLVSTLNQHGTIASLVNKSNEVLVQIGSMKMMINLNNLEKCNITDINCSNRNNIHSSTTKQHTNTTSSTKTNKTTSTFSYSTSKTRNATTEINVIGYNIEEAIFVIDKYLDDCTLAKLSSVRIVHGKGTGALRKGIHAFLKMHPHVKNFRLGTFGEGETGVTIAELK